MLMLISPAYADGVAPAGNGGLLLQLSAFLLIFVVMYFLMIRPQQKRAAAHQKAIGEMKRGDRVVTNSGLIGTITRVREHEFLIEIAENVQVTVVKQAVASLYDPAAVRCNGGCSTDSKKGNEPKAD